MRRTAPGQRLSGAVVLSGMCFPMSETGAAKINCAVGFRLVDHDPVVVYIQGEKLNYLPVVHKGEE